MAYQSLDPIDLSTAAVGDSYTALPSGQYEGVAQVLLTNNSGFAFNISASSMGELPPLSAYSSAAYNAPPNGGALTATISGGQPGNQPPVQLGIMLAFGTSNFSGVSQAVGSVNIGSEVNITGSVTVDSITGTVDANITNASIPVTGDVQANVTNATLTVDGTVSLTAGQVVEVTNESGGSLTVAGEVNIGTAPTITIDANGSNVTVDEMPIGTLLATIPVGSSSYTLDAATVGKNNSLTILGTTNDLRSIAGIQQSAAPNYLLPMGQAIGPEGATEILAVVCDIPANMGVQIEFVGTTSADVLVYGSTGIDYVAATIVNLPLTLIGWGGNVPAVQVAPSLPVMTVSVPEPAAGATWSYTLPYPAKVTAVVAELVSASGGSDPALSVGPIALYWDTGTLAAGTYYLKAWPGPPALAVVSQFGNILLAIPDLGVLPAGTVIAGSGQAAADQWSNVTLLLEPS